MAGKTAVGSVKRFGPRYGRNLKDRFGRIETSQRKLHKCPYCSFVKVKRLSVGVWECKKCEAKFASKAYTVSKFPAVKKAVEI